MKTIPERHIPERGDFLLINANFEEIGEVFGIDLEMIDCGAYPNDARGESLRSTMQKINRNFLKVGNLLEMTNED